MFTASIQYIELFKIFIIFIKMKFTLIFILLVQLIISWVPKIVWTYWDEPLEKAHHLIQALHSHHKTILQPKGWQLRHLDGQTMKLWIEPIQIFKILVNHPAWKEMNKAKQALCMRVALLSHYGGVWMDMSIILTTDLDWLFNLKVNQHIENEYGDQPEIFFTYARHTNKQIYQDPKDSKKVLLNPIMENFFFASKNSSKMLKDYIKFIVEAIVENYPEYRYRLDQDKESIFLDIARRQKINTGAYNTKYFEIGLASIIVLHRKQAELDLQWKKGGVRKFAVREYGIWNIDVNFNGYSFQYIGKSRTNFWHQSFLYYNKDQFLIDGKMPAFFKFFKLIHNKFIEILKTEPSKKNSCYPRFILNSSILYYYILKDYPTKFYSNQVVNETFFQQKCRAFIQIDNVFAQNAMIWNIVLESKTALEQRKVQSQYHDQQIQKFKSALQELKKGSNTTDKLKTSNHFQQNQTDIELQALKTDLKNLIMKSEQQASQIQQLQKKNSQYESQIRSHANQNNKQTVISDKIQKQAQKVIQNQIMLLKIIIFVLVFGGVLLSYILNRMYKRRVSQNNDQNIINAEINYASSQNTLPNIQEQN